MPDPNTPCPLPHAERVVFLKPHITRANITVGDFSYYDSPNAPERFEDTNVLYHYEAMGDRLIIGKYCALAHGTTFIMNGANHRLDGISTYPFPIFGDDWEQHMDLLMGLPSRGDTVVGNDVWLGMGALVMPGVSIGDGAIIAARAVVSTDVPPYSVIAGNPAKVVKTRFTPDEIERLIRIAWWDWSQDAITQHLATIISGDVNEIETIASNL